MPRSAVPPQSWTDPAWLAEVRAWVDSRLAENGAQVTGKVTQPHTPWWSTALRVPTSEGVVWFKAARDPAGFEARLAEMLEQIAPRRSAELVASDPDRAWMLTRDAGTRLREHAQGLEQLRCWEELLPPYAELQGELSGRVDELLAIGVPDLRLPVVASLGERLSQDVDMLQTAPEDALDDAELAEFRDRGTAELRRLCDELGSRGIPDSLQHDDFHDGNTFVRAGDYVFFDWGDACISHPFHTLVVTLRVLGYKLGLPPGAPELLRLRDAYLEPWSAHGTRAELLEAADLARRTGTVQRALAWYDFVQRMPPELRHEEQDSVPYGVRLFLRNGDWGTWC